MDKVIRRVLEATEGTKGYTGTKRVIELRKDWTEMRIRVEVKKNWGRGE